MENPYNFGLLGSSQKYPVGRCVYLTLLGALAKIPQQTKRTVVTLPCEASNVSSEMD